MAPDGVEVGTHEGYQRASRLVAELANRGEELLGKGDICFSSRDQYIAIMMFRPR